MGVQVLGEPRSGGVSLVDPHVHAMRFEGPLHETDREIDQFPESGSFHWSVIEESRPGLAQGHQKMTVGVRESIQHHQPEFVPMDHKRLFVQLGVIPGVSDEVLEDGRLLPEFLSASFEVPKVGHPPGGPEIVVHGRSSGLEEGIGDRIGRPGGGNRTMNAWSPRRSWSP